MFLDSLKFSLHLPPSDVISSNYLLLCTTNVGYFDEVLAIDEVSILLTSPVT